MLETKIQSTTPLKYQSIFWNELKNRTQSIADCIAHHEPRWAERMEKCADVLRFREIANGHLSFIDAWFCRVRGCPICEWRRARQVAARVSHAVENTPNVLERKWKHIAFSCPLDNASRIKESIDNAHKGFNRISRLKSWKMFRGGFRFTEINYLGNSVQVTVHGLLVASKTLGGKNYTNKKQWDEFWKRSVRCCNAPRTEVKTLGVLSPFEAGYYAYNLALAGTNLELCPDTIISEVVRGISNRTFLSVQEILKEKFQEDRRDFIPKRKYCPSEIANLQRMKTTYFAHLPNPETL